jgi:hypothetical protein
MFVTVIGQTAFVGDTRLAGSIAATQPAVATALARAGGPATPETMQSFDRQLDRTAERMRSFGLAVVRVPLMPSATPRAWVSYNNGIVETRAGRSIYYMPTFAAGPLDDAAANVFRAAGCDVVPIDCSAVWPLGGSLHCLVNVIERRQP